MKMSDNVADLFAALCLFQGELETASKARAGHNYKYADLAECISTAKEPLLKHGLAVTQMLGFNDTGKQTMITMLTHKSGQYISSEFVMVDAVLSGGGGKNPAQILGSAITYQRRYAYAAIIGLAQEDDDAKNVRARNEHARSQTALIDSDRVCELKNIIEGKGYKVSDACASLGITSLDSIQVGSYPQFLSAVKGW